MNARDTMLGKLLAAAPKSTGNCGELDRRIDAHFNNRRAARAVSRQDLVQAMQEALTASHAEVWCASRADWAASLAQKLAAQGVRRVLLNQASTEGAVLTQALPAQVQSLSFTQPLEAWKSELFDTVDAGFTIARSGIASTGTLIIAPDAGTPRTVSLVPPLHIALVYANTLHADLHAAAKAESWSKGMPTNLVLASGPSKTSDIQQTLAFGAHGPRWMWVIIVTDDAAGGSR